MQEHYLELGSQVFVFFEAGDINKPVYFAAAQSGPGWFSEHPNQHVFHSDNVRVRIDEEPSHPDSTCQFDSYNTENNVFSQADGTKYKTNTRIDIEVLATDINAVNVQIYGDINMKVVGDWYVHHEGAKHETHIGDTYIRHIGDTVIEEEGCTINRKIGDLQEFIDGAVTNTITETYTGSILGDVSQNIGGNTKINIAGLLDEMIGGSATYKITDFESKTIGAEQRISVNTDIIENAGGNFKAMYGGVNTQQSRGSIRLETEKRKYRFRDFR